MLREDRPGRGGDHESFLDQGIPGVRFIETVESPNAGTVASHQHSPNDLPTYVTPYLDTRFLASVRSGTTGTGLGMIMMPGGGMAVPCARPDHRPRASESPGHG